MWPLGRLAFVGRFNVLRASILRTKVRPRPLSPFVKPLSRRSVFALEHEISESGPPHEFAKGYQLPEDLSAGCQGTDHANDQDFASPLQQSQQRDPVWLNFASPRHRNRRSKQTLR